MNHEDHNKQDDDRDDAPLAALRGYDLSVEPQRDLWPGIEARIAPRRRLPGRVSANAWMSIAAAACVAAVVGLAVLRPLPPPQAATQTVAMAEMETATPDLHAVSGSRALVKANLQLSRQSEQQIRKALERDPDSASLRRLLLTTETRSDELRRMLAARSST